MSQQDGPPVPRKRLTLADIMLVVAATAVGIAGYKLLADDESFSRFYLALATPLLLAWSWALFLVVARDALRRPRPRFQRVFRRPGTVAAGMVVFVSVLEAVFVALAPVVSNHIVGNAYIIPEPRYYLAFCLDDTGKAVVVAWLALFLAGAWKPEPRWTDRTGRALGILWIAYWVAGALGFN